MLWRDARRESDAFVTASLAFALASCVAWVVRLDSFDTSISLAATAVDGVDFDLFAASTCSIADDCDDDFLLDNCRRCRGRQVRRIIIVEARLAPSCDTIVVIIFKEAILLCKRCLCLCKKMPITFARAGGRSEGMQQMTNDTFNGRYFPAKI